MGTIHRFENLMRSMHHFGTIMGDSCHNELDVPYWSFSEVDALYFGKYTKFLFSRCTILRFFIKLKFWEWCITYNGTVIELVHQNGTISRYAANLNIIRCTITFKFLNSLAFSVSQIHNVFFKKPFKKLIKTDKARFSLFSLDFFLYFSHELFIWLEEKVTLKKGTGKKGQRNSNHWKSQKKNSWEILKFCDRCTIFGPKFSKTLPVESSMERIYSTSFSTKFWISRCLCKCAPTNVFVWT